ncbi:MAG: serine/threonine-protein phosphatase [Leptospirales bacterium]|nr:serine/threonine-protein phosphatase [Leptospirales bacterium]
MTTVRRILYERVQQLNFLLHGDRVRFAVEQRLFNMAALYGALVGIAFTAFNVSLGLGWQSVAVLAPSGLIFGAIYALSRFSRRWRDRYYKMAFPAMLLASAGMLQLWFVNGGSWGGSQYFLFVHIAMAVIVLRGWHRRFGVTMILALAFCLLLVEYQHPEWIRDYDTRSQRYTDLFVSLLSGLAAIGIIVGTLQVGLSRRVKNAQDDRLLLKEDLSLARMLQGKVFEISAAEVSDFEFEVAHHSSGELTGDLYDVTRLSPDRLRIFLADARGHGINAALSAMIIKSEWLHTDPRLRSPGEALTAINQTIVERYQDSISFSAIVADIDAAEICYACAGQISLALAEGGQVRDLTGGGPPVGMLPSLSYPEERAALSNQSLLLFFTDGFTDAIDVNGRFLGADWVSRLVESLVAPNARKLATSFVDRFALMVGQSPRGLLPQDDCTLLVVSPYRRTV